jgi:hypothetical protein
MEDVPEESMAAPGEGIVQASSGPELEVVRELARKAHPDAIPELIDGGSVAEIMASVEPARSAYARVFQEVTDRQQERNTRPPLVPAGGSIAGAVDPDTLPAAEKLRRGVQAARRQGT